jgi:UDP-N-acetyl-2-amino-2-deoxyglucuronate dehydrogenase
MTIHIGLIGGGNITETHARAARAIPGVEIAAIQGSNLEKVSKLCREHGGKPYQDFNAFLSYRPMDLVVIGSPTGLHADQGIAAAKQGLHVLTDKAIDVSTKRADDLIEATDRGQVKLGVIFQDRAQPQIRQLKQWIDKGLLGKILLVDAKVKWWRPAEYYSDSRWRGANHEGGGGMLINHAIHTIDLLLWLFGDVTRLHAHTATKLHKIPVEDTTNALLEFVSGASGIFQATTAAYPGYPRRVEITGTEGTVILEHDRVIAANLRNPPGGMSTVAPPDTNASASSPVVSDFRGHKAVLEDFLKAIKENGKPLCDGHEGRRSVALIEAIYRAANIPGVSLDV